jgi:hypothetical protein
MMRVHGWKRVLAWATPPCKVLAATLRVEQRDGQFAHMPHAPIARRASLSQQNYSAFQK